MSAVTDRIDPYTMSDHTAKRTCVYLSAEQPRNTIAARYVRLFTFGRFDLALTWIVREHNRAAATR